MRLWTNWHSWPFTCKPCCVCEYWSVLRWCWQGRRVTSREEMVTYYISLLIIPCITIMWQIKKPWTLNPLEYWSTIITPIHTLVIKPHTLFSSKISKHILNEINSLKRQNIVRLENIFWSKMFFLPNWQIIFLLGSIINKLSRLYILFGAIIVNINTDCKTYSYNLPFFEAIP